MSKNVTMKSSWMVNYSRCDWNSVFPIFFSVLGCFLPFTFFGLTHPEVFLFSLLVTIHRKVFTSVETLQQTHWLGKTDWMKLFGCQTFGWLFLASAITNHLKFIEARTHTHTLHVMNPCVCLGKWERTKNTNLNTLYK